MAALSPGRQIDVALHATARSAFNGVGSLAYRSSPLISLDRSCARWECIRLCYRQSVCDILSVGSIG